MIYPKRLLATRGHEGARNISREQSQSYNENQYGKKDSISRQYPYYMTSKKGINLAIRFPATQEKTLSVGHGENTLRWTEVTGH